MAEGVSGLHAGQSYDMNATSTVKVLQEEGDLPITERHILDRGREQGYKTDYTARVAIDALFNPAGGPAQDILLATAGITYVDIPNQPGARALSGASLARACFS